MTDTVPPGSGQRTKRGGPLSGSRGGIAIRMVFVFLSVSLICSAARETLDGIPDGKAK
jgi:hypothetical protein